MKRHFNILYIYIAILLNTILIFNNNILAQRSYGSKVFTGGNISLQFGSVTLVDISPIIGYRLTEKIDIGLGLTYKYYKYSDYFYYYLGNTYYDLVSNIYGASIFGRYHFSENIFAHAEFEYLDYEYTDYLVYTSSVIKQKKAIDVESIFIGGGYRQEMGDNIYLTLMLLYNLNETKYSPYSNPIIRVGFNYGL